MSHSATPAVAQSAPRGRPADPRKDMQILAAAGRLFMKDGVQGTTMEQIAREADVSKLTLYRRFPDKNTLFTAVVSDKCRQYLPEEIFEITKGAEPAEALTRLGCGLLSLITSEDAVNLNRVITTESAHNPQMTAQFYSQGPQRVKTRTLEMMTALKTSGTLNITDPAEAAEMFSALIVGSEFTKRCNMNMCPLPTAAQIRAYVQKAVNFFLRAYKG